MVVVFLSACLSEREGGGGGEEGQEGWIEREGG